MIQLKKITFQMLFLFCVSNVLLAQEFTIAPNPVFAEGTADDTPLVAYAELTNNTDEIQTVVWERTEEELPVGWTSNVCTSEGCILAEIPIGDFTILPGESLNVDIQFNPGWVAGEGQVEVKLYFESDSSNYIMVTYTGDATPVSVTELSELEFEIYPNPMKSFFQMKGKLDEYDIKLLDILGKEMHVQVTDTGIVDVSSLQAGIYAVVVMDKKGSLLQIIPATVF